MSVLVGFFDHIREWATRPSGLVRERIDAIEELSQQILDAERKAREKTNNGRR